MHDEPLTTVGSEREAKHTLRNTQLEADGSVLQGMVQLSCAGCEGAGLGEAGVSGRLPEEVHRIARARDEIRRKAREGRKQKSLCGLEGQQAAPGHLAGTQDEQKRRRGAVRK